MRLNCRLVNGKPTVRLDVALTPPKVVDFGRVPDSILLYGSLAEEGKPHRAVTKLKTSPGGQ